jgi:hypothetical protein
MYISQVLTDTHPVVPLTLSPTKLTWIWERMERRPSEFSELTIPDPQAFEAAVFSRDLLWYEFPDETADRSKGLIAMRHEPGSPEAVLMLTMLDKRVRDKAEPFMDWLTWVFGTFPINRLTMEVPDVHFGMRRLVERTHWRREGTKRQAIRLPGRWVNVGIYGLLREEM